MEYNMDKIWFVPHVEELVKKFKDAKYKYDANKVKFDLFNNTDNPLVFDAKMSPIGIRLKNDVRWFHSPDLGEVGAYVTQEIFDNFGRSIRNNAITLHKYYMDEALAVMEDCDKQLRELHNIKVDYDAIS